MKYSPKEKARIGNYAVQHGTSAALRHYNKEFPNLKWTTVWTMFKKLLFLT